MQAIGSSNGWYNVHRKSTDKPIKMSLEGGEKLSAYLENEPAAFVHIKDTSGKEYTIRTMTIDTVERYDPSSSISYKTVTELGMPDLYKS